MVNLYMRKLNRFAKHFPLVHNALRKIERAIFSPPPTAEDKIYKIPLPTFEIINTCRLLFFKRMLDLVSDVEGDIVECGVGRGRSLLLLSLLSFEEGKGRQIWGFDSFEGLPEPTEEDDSPHSPKKGNYPANMEGVRALLYEADLGELFMRSKITLVKGFFNESLHKYAGQGDCTVAHRR